MKLPELGRQNQKMNISFLPKEDSSTGNGLHLIEFLVYRNYRTTQAIVKSVSGSPKSNRKDPLLKVTPTQFIKKKTFTPGW